MPQAGRRRSLAAIPPLRNHDLRHHEFDPYYEKCKLLSWKKFFIKKYTLQPGASIEGHKLTEVTIVIVAALQQKDLDGTDPIAALKRPRIADILCREGVVDSVNTANKDKTGVNKDAYQCGLATLLSFLCLIDANVQGTGLGNKLENLEGQGEEGKELAEFAKARCQKIVYFLNAANPAAGSKAYLYAAIDANYGSLMTFHPFKASPKSANFNVCDILDELNQKELNLDEFRREFGDAWYFCMIKTPWQFPSCSIL